MEQCSIWYSLCLCGLLTNSSGTTHSTSQVGLAGLGLQPGSCPHVHVLIFTDIRKYCAYLGGHHCNIKATFTCTYTVASGALHSFAYLIPTQPEVMHRSHCLVVRLLCKVLGNSLSADPRGRCFCPVSVLINFAGSQLSTSVWQLNKAPILESYISKG